MSAHLHRITDSDFPQQLLKPGEGTPNLSRNSNILLDESLGQLVHHIENLHE